MERKDVDELLLFLFLLSGIIFGINDLKNINYFITSKGNKSFESRHQDIFLENQFDIIHFKI